ncbi:MAG: alkaline phosphatase [Verrucomicrobia bacterium]|nr:alkaline phosphatase [Verrucomicrobiota bacterium]MDA1203578.1 alkaline phosphatase [Verrucomicrobiota bacterium]
MMRGSNSWWVSGAVYAVCAVTGWGVESQVEQKAKKGSAIFYHVDGAGVAHWQMARMLVAGPDGEINWDHLPHIAIYRGHAEDTLTPSSNAGATMHAYGSKVPYAAYGTDQEGKPPLSPAARRKSIMQEAQERGLAVGVVNTGGATEPGTACFLTSVPDRGSSDEIVAQLVESGADVILAGGEPTFLPAGKKGKHGVGVRKDGRNLIEEARTAGYRVIFTRKELNALGKDAGKVLGIFAEDDTFNDESEEKLAASGLPNYDPAAPTVAEMTSAALRLFGDRQFLLVVEEEGADNFGNANNAAGTLEALVRADQGLGVILDYIGKHPDTLVLTCADSEAGDPDVVGLRGASFERAMMESGKDGNGAPVDGAGRTAEGGVAKPFVSAPDRAGKKHRFVVVWGTGMDTSGAIVARAAGLNAEKVQGTFDNTAVYPLFYETLFGEAPGGK